MLERWTPPLTVREHAGHCRLVLAGVTHGDGPTLQEAADDLIARLLNVVLRVRANGLPHAPDLGPIDTRMAEFLWELGQDAANGRDLRDRLF
jgi:hypothetical protein